MKKMSVMELSTYESTGLSVAASPIQQDSGNAYSSRSNFMYGRRSVYDTNWKLRIW